MMDTAERSGSSVLPPADSKRPALVGSAIHVAWVIALAAVVVGRVVRFGFFPADQGFVLAGSWRLLNGEIPHVDFVSPRPQGSGLLHLIDFLIPAPLFITSVFLMVVEIIVFTIACAALLTGTSPLQWGPLRTLLVAAASLINLHLFAGMAWHTIDGLMLTAVGWWMLDIGLRSQSAWQRRIGLALLGFAVLTKQSFALAVPIGLLILFLHPDGRKLARSWSRIIVDLLCLGAFPILYFGVITAAGGLGEAIVQLTDVHGAYGEPLFWLWQNDFSAIFDTTKVDWRRAILAVFVAGLIIAVAWLARARLGMAGMWLRILVAAGAAALTVYSLAATHLTYPPTWSVKIAWIFVAVLALDAVVRKHFPWRPLLLVVLAYSASLSWGYNYPALLAGTLVLATLEILLAAVPEARIVPRVATALAGVVAFAGASYLLVDARDNTEIANPTHDKLTADLGSVTPAMSGIRTSPNVATYVGQIRDCLQRYPAHDVAVLPDNSFVYPAMKLHNPFPLDWSLPWELVADSIPRTNAAIDRMNSDGNYLVLFQTVETGQLYKGLPASVPLDTPIVANSDAVQLAKDRLTGERITCGSFVGVWSR
ncbi:MAG: hypothetical protein ABW224_15115 [Kibdelosporangium sp.]